MIQKLEKILKAHAKTMEAIPQRYEAEMKFNKANFAGQWLETKTHDARVRRDTDTYNAKDSANRQIKEVITELRTKVNTMASKTDTEALATLSALKEMKMSKGEIQSWVDRYHDDYMCMKMLCDIASKNNLSLKYTSIDDLFDAIQKLEEVSTSFINSYKGDLKNWTYSEGLITIPEHPFGDYQQLFNSSTIDVIEKPKAPLTESQKATLKTLFDGQKDIGERSEELTAMGMNGANLLSDYLNLLSEEPTE